MMQQTKNRWLIVLAAIGIHISIGSVYAWSVLTKPIMQAMGFSLKEVTWTFSLAILFLGTSAGFLGTYVEKYGPRRSGLISMCFFVSGLLGTAYALTQHSLLLLYLFYGVIGGIGLGTGYITPVSTLVKWFPNNRGLATGLAIMGFGFASLVAGPLMQILIAKYGLVENFVILACIYAVVMTASALYLEPPKQETVAGKGQFKAQMPEHVQYTVKEAMHTWQFYALWWIFFTNITCGIGLLAVASPMAQEVIGMSPIAAASMVGIIGLLNGGGFSCMPAYLSDLFGTKQLSAIHGRILTAWGLAGIAGPLLLSVIYERTHSYSFTLYFFSACFVVSLLLAAVLKLKGKTA